VVEYSAYLLNFYKTDLLMLIPDKYTKYFKIVLLISIMSISLAIRLPGLTRISLTPDEVWEYDNCSAGMNTLLNEIDSDVHPTFRFIYHFWLLLDNTESHMRLFSVITGTLGVFFAYLIGRELYGFYFGCISALIFGLSPHLSKIGFQKNII